MNRYIKAMEIGLAHEKNGISYNDLKSKLIEDLDIALTENSESTFVYWFIENFRYRNGWYETQSFRFKWLGYLDYENGDLTKQNDHDFIKSFFVNKYFLNGEASKHYLDYKEYKSASRNSLIATGFAIISILLATGSYMLSYKSDKNQPVPPYEVKIIENHPRTKELEKENNQLKEDLYKAEMMVRVLEEKSN